jgi:hypothetical protein
MAEDPLATKLHCQNCNSLTPIFDPNIPDLPFPNLSHLLGIDRLLSNEEQTLARDVAAEAGKRAAILDPQIDLLEKLSSAISKVHTELQIHRNKMNQIKVEHQRLASSGLMRQMIPEILSEIFLHHQSPFSFLADLKNNSLRLGDPSLTMEQAVYNSFSLLYGPLLLTQICRRWREVAISTPQIWTTISFVESRSNLSKPSPNLVDLWVTRSRQLPLRICIQEISKLEIGRSRLMHKAIHRLFHYSHRWQELYIASSNFKSRWKRFYAFRSRLPLLRVLVLQSWQEAFRGIPDSGDLDLFSDAPLLTEVSISQSPGFLASMVFPFSQLTRVNFKRISLFAFLGFLAKAPQLEECKIACFLTEDTSLTLPQCPPHLQLGVFVLKMDVKGCCELLLPRLEFPNLNTFAMRLDYFSPFAADNLRDFIKRTKNLSFFTLITKDISGETLAECLIDHPSLVHVHWNISKADLIKTLLCLRANQGLCSSSVFTRRLMYHAPGSSPAYISTTFYRRPVDGPIFPVFPGHDMEAE